MLQMEWRETIEDAISNKDVSSLDSLLTEIKRNAKHLASQLKQYFDEKAYALAAGREIRIFVTPEQVSDVEAKLMARDIAQKIEQELNTIQKGGKKKAMDQLKKLKKYQVAFIQTLS